MVPNAEQTAVNRQLMAAFIRFFGWFTLLAVIVWWGIDYILMYRSYFVNQQGGGGGFSPFSVQTLPQRIAYVWDGMAKSPLTLILFGLIMISIPNRLARMLVRFPRTTACPGCGYSLEAVTDLRCPECGLGLTPAFRPQQSIPGEGDDTSE